MSVTGGGGVLGKLGGAFLVEDIDRFLQSPSNRSFPSVLTTLAYSWPSLFVAKSRSVASAVFSAARNISFGRRCGGVIFHVQLSSPLSGVVQSAVLSLGVVQHSVLLSPTGLSGVVSGVGGGTIIPFCMTTSSPLSNLLPAESNSSFEAEGVTLITTDKFCPHDDFSKCEDKEAKACPQVSHFLIFISAISSDNSIFGCMFLKCLASSLAYCAIKLHDGAEQGNIPLLI